MTTFAGTVRLEGPQGPVEVVGAGERIRIRLQRLGQWSSARALAEAIVERTLLPAVLDVMSSRSDRPLRVDLFLGQRRLATWSSDRPAFRLPGLNRLGRWRPDPLGWIRTPTDR